MKYYFINIIHSYRHARWPVDVVELFPRVCCWTVIRLSRHWAWLRRGYWRYRNLFVWLIVICLLLDQCEILLLLTSYIVTGMPDGLLMCGTLSSSLLLNSDSAVAPLSLASPGILRYRNLFVWLIVICLLLDQMFQVAAEWWQDMKY